MNLVTIYIYRERERVIGSLVGIMWCAHGCCGPIHSHRFLTSTQTSQFWRMQASVINLLHAQRSLQLFIAFVHPENDAAATASFTKKEIPSPRWTSCLINSVLLVSIKISGEQFSFENNCSTNLRVPEPFSFMINGSFARSLMAMAFFLVK